MFNERKYSPGLFWTETDKWFQLILDGEELQKKDSPEEVFCDIQRAVEAVLAGEMTFQQASEAFKIPEATITPRKKTLGNFILKQVNCLQKEVSSIHFVIQDICSNVCACV